MASGRPPRCAAQGRDQRPKVLLVRIVPDRGPLPSVTQDRPGERARKTDPPHWDKRKDSCEGDALRTAVFSSSMNGLSGCAVYGMAGYDSHCSGPFRKGLGGGRSIPGEGRRERHPPPQSRPRQAHHGRRPVWMVISFCYSSKSSSGNGLPALASLVLGSKSRLHVPGPVEIGFGRMLSWLFIRSGLSLLYPVRPGVPAQFFSRLREVVFA